MDEETAAWFHAKRAGIPLDWLTENEMIPGEKIKEEEEQEDFLKW
jgi:hypothetical protein